MSFYGCVSELLFFVARPFLNRKYDEGNGQRYGRYPEDLPKGALWIHAVSVGEVQSAYPFVMEIKRRNPDMPILLSTITKTGRAMAARLTGDLVRHIYYPWDSPSVLKRALATLRPAAYITIETEIWPEMLFQLRKRRIPAFLVNGRLSESSFRKYRRLRFFWKRVIRRYSLIMTRSAPDRDRFIALGAEPDRVKVTGDCKVDALIARKNAADGAGLGEIFAGKEPLILAGSTHEGEEEVVFDAYAELLKVHPSLKLVVVPRHPERGRALLDKASARKLGRVELMSKARSGWNVLIVDRIGVLFPIYGYVKAAFLGGSLVPKGGQNIMEPAIWGVPFCQGPDSRDFAEATEALKKTGLCAIVRDAREMRDFFDGVLSHDNSDFDRESREFFAALSGASRRSWDLITEFRRGNCPGKTSVSVKEEGAIWH